MSVYILYLNEKPLIHDISLEKINIELNKNISFLLKRYNYMNYSYNYNIVKDKNNNVFISKSLKYSPTTYNEYLDKLNTIEMNNEEFSKFLETNIVS